MSLDKLIKNSLQCNFAKELRDLKKAHQKEIYKLNLSFTCQVEELQETLSDTLGELTNLKASKNELGWEFVRMHEKAQEKFKEVKTKN